MTVGARRGRDRRRLRALLALAVLSWPVAAHANDERLFVVEREGRVLVYVPGTGVLPTPFLDIRSAVDDSGDDGFHDQPHPNHNNGQTGNGFPAPLQVNTRAAELLCVPTTAVDAGG